MKRDKLLLFYQVWVVFILLLIAGCTETIIPPSPETAEMQPTEAESSSPTSVPSPTVIAVPELSSRAYTHSQKLFRLYPPVGWSVDEQTDGAQFRAPDATSMILVHVTNTGFPLDSDAFERFIQAREMKLFGNLVNTVTLESRIEKSQGNAEFTKSFIVDNTSQIVRSIYQQSGQIISAVDFWSEQNLSKAYDSTYSEIYDHFTVDPKASADLDIYIQYFIYECPLQLCTIEVPLTWTYNKKQSQYATIDIFTAPDKKAVLQIAHYDDGQIMSKPLAGEFTLFLMRSYLGRDIFVSQDKVIPKGGERLDWSTYYGDYQGVTIFETQDTAFLIVLAMYDKEHQPIYGDFLDRVLNSYQK